MSGAVVFCASTGVEMMQSEANKVRSFFMDDLGGGISGAESSTRRGRVSQVHWRIAQVSMQSAVM
jgi:hypothetical protein